MEKTSIKNLALPILFIVLGVSSIIAQPTFTSVPTNGATNANQSADIVLTFNEAIRDAAPGNAALDDTSIDSHITLKLTNSSGANIAFDATINGGKTVVTINPTSDLPSGAVIYVAIADVENLSNITINPNPTTFTFTVADYLAPTITFNPLNGATGVAVASNLTITFDEPVRKIDDSAITSGDLNSLVELKLTNDAGSSVPFTASINGGNTVITVDPTSDLSGSTLYYLEINPVEDFSNNATSATSITFTTADITPPVVTFNPVNGATGVVESNNITITFDEPVRKIDNSAITPGDLATLVELKLTDNSGANVPFSASINGGNTIITIDPTSNLSPNTIYYVEINPVEDFSDNAIVATNITFTTGNTLPPDISFNPVDGATNVPVASNFTITFSEPVRKIDDSAITPADLATLVELKLTNNAGANVPFSASINGANTVITVDPSSNLSSSTLYYLQINPVEDFANNATIATSITFTSADVLPPNITFNPVNGATGVLETANLTITFNEPVRKINNDAITPADLATLVELKLTNDAGAPVTFTASINGGNTIITIDPTLDLAGNTTYYLEINPVEDFSDNATVATNITFTTGDTQGPIISSTVPSDNATNVSVKLTTLSITFNENVVYVGDNSNADNMIRIRDIDGNAFADTIEVANVGVSGATVTFTTNYSFLPNNNYAIRIGNSVFEDSSGNPFAGILAGDNTTWNFQTEQAPNISSLSTTTRCIGDQLVINGSRFTGTGGSGNTKPVVRINGNIVHTDSIKSYSTNTITLIVPPNATTGNVTVFNDDSDLLSNGISLTVRPQINTGLTVTPATLNPAQNTNVNITVANTQDGNYNYDLILTSAPGGYSLTPPASVHTVAGNSGTRTLNTSEGADPDLTHIGDYTYRIDVSRTGCTTRTLSNTPFTLTVASLDVTVSATNTSVCEGSSTILIGSTSGGTGFYQFSWTGPNGFSSSSSSPTIIPAHPAGTGWYICTLSDNSANTDKDSVYITTYPVSAVSFQPVGGAPNVQTEYTNQDQLFELNASPTQLISGGATFSGSGVVAKADSNKYYFNPQLAGNGLHTITYTYNDGNCSNSTSLQFRVSATFIENLEPYYCENNGLSNLLSLSSPTGTNYLNTYYNGWTHTRLRFLRYEYNSSLGYYEFKYYDSVTQPNLDPLNFIDNPSGTRPRYQLDVAELVSNHGVAPANTYYYIVVFASDPNKLANPAGYPGYVDEAVLYNYFRIVPLGLPPNITGINEGGVVCSNTTAINLSQSIAGYTINSFAFTNGTFNSALLTSPHRFDPSLISSSNFEENLTLRLNYDDYNGCVNTVDRNFTWVKRPLAPFASDTAYCQVTDGQPRSYIIAARPQGPASNPNWYNADPSGSPPVLDSVNFLFTAPGVNGLTPGTTQFYVTQSYKGCEGATRPVQLIIKTAPNAQITRGAICEDRDFSLSGPEESPGVPYTNYSWTFGDGKSASIDNDSTTTHNYGPGTGSAPYTIGLTVTNSLGCTNSDTDNITVGLNPKPDFTYEQVCDGDLTEFFGTTDISVSEFEWDFGDLTVIPRGPIAGPAPEGGTIQSPHHNFSNGANNYTVTATSYTPAGCFNSKTKTVSILPYLKYTTTSPYISQNENGGDGFLTIEDIKGNSTWEFNIPTTPFLSRLGTVSWVTNANLNYLPLEKAYLNTPCFDLDSLARPVMTIEFAMNTQLNGDGVVIEWSKDGGINWNALGNTVTGANWFNTSNFFSGTIGNSTVGWSGNSWDLEDNAQKDTVVEGRRSLDNIPNLSRAERAKVRFRIVFQSNGDRELEGFGFRSLRVESRNRTLLVENFTNEGDTDYGSNIAAFNNISSLESVKIQYHLKYPSSDNNSRINSEDQNARAAYYGITLTDSGIPRAYIDGYSNGNFGPWSTNRFDKRSLVSSPLNLSIESQDTTGVGFLKVLVTMEALQNIALIGKPLLHIAAVEKKDATTSNDFVLRKFFGSTSGKPLSQITSFPITQGSIIQYVDRVYLDDSRINYDSLALVVFIQDEFTKEVYQAAIELNPAFLPDGSLITDAEDPDYANKINIYPNPANEVVNIVLPQATSKATPVTLTDGYGRVIYESYFDAGQQHKTVSTDNLAGGIYILQVGTPNGGVARKKVLVVHQ
jgi:hypothetical protein